jgi:uncharacterized protein YjdB
MKCIKLSNNGTGSRPAFARALLKPSVALALGLFLLPCLLSAQTLQHRYSFASDASDSVGTANGTVVAPNGGTAVSIANGLTLPGGGGPGFSGIVTLPAGILNTTTNLTVECWFTQSAQNTWAELFSFNNGTPEYFAFIPYPDNNNHNMEMAFRVNNNENDADSGIQFPTGSEQYMAGTFNAATLTDNLYLNGALIATGTVPDDTYIPGTYNSQNNYLGQDPWPDPQFQGTIYEFRIWNGAVSPLYLQASAVAGPSVVVTNWTPTSVTVSANPLALNGAGQVAVTIELPQTGSATFAAASYASNWVSSNPSVFTINSNGFITAVGLGSATVSATFGGVTGTSAPISVVPTTLLHRYSFASDASDSVGSADGTLVAPNGGAAATINNGLILPGNTHGNFGYSGYVSLPAGILTNTTSLTVECWVTQNQGNTWSEIWDFGIDNSHNFGLIPDPANNGANLEAAFEPNGGEVDMQTLTPFPNGAEQYVAVTYNNQTLVGNLFTNGVLDGTQTFPNTSYCPGTIGGAAGTTENMLGNDVFGDWQFGGTIYEFRIWNGAVSPAYLEASAAAGSGVVITNLTPQSLNIQLSTTSMIGAGQQQATVIGNFIQVSDVTVTAAATNWTSSNPSVLSVNSSGLITAINGGTASVSATVNGVTATSATINVATTSPVMPQKPASLTVAVSDTAVFSVQALGGSLSYQWSFNSTPIPGATTATLTLTNVSLAEAGTYSISVTNTMGSTNASAVLTVEQAILKHRYSFVSDASDSVGNANGTIVAPGNGGGAPATISNGLSLPGNTVGGFGYSGYVSLPPGLLTNTTSLTIETWVTQNQPNTWATVWDFADNGNINFELCPFPNRNGGDMVAAFTPNNNEDDLDTGVSFPSGSEQYVVLTVNASILEGELYTNGVPVGTVTLPNATYLPKAIGGVSGTVQDMLGNDTYGDQQFSGTIYEFRIWNGAVSPLYLAVSAAAGPSVVVTDLTPDSMLVTVTNSTMIEGESQPASVVANFANASGINVMSYVTNWTSSATNVLTVNSSGQVTAVGTGSATISATVNGFIGTSAPITVPNNAPVITQNPAASETLLVGATFTTSVANIGTPPFTYYWFTSSPTPISTSGSPTLTIPNVQAVNAASYTCVVSNQYGTATSSPVVLAVVASTTYQQAVLSYGPVGFWPLNETGGTIAYDVVGGNNGTYNGGYSLGNTGPANSTYAAGFDGNSAYVDIPEGSLNITNAITVVAWVQVPGENGFQDVFGHGDQSWRLTVNQGGDPGANDGAPPADATGSTSIIDGNWHMMAYSYNGFVDQANSGALYVDGALVANNTVNVVPAGDNLDAWIGGAPDYGTGSQKRLLAGNIANVAVFAQGLTAAQVAGIYSGTFVAGPNTLSISNSASGLVLSWQEGTLLQAPTVRGPWTTNYTAVPPYTVQPTNGSHYFKLLLKP